MHPAPGAARTVAGAAATVLAAALLCLPTVRAASQADPSAADAVARAASLGVTTWPESHGSSEGASGDLALPPAPPDPAAAVPAPAAPPAAAAPPAPVQHRPAPPGLERRARTALAALGYPWQELGYDIHFAARGDSAHLGFVDPEARQITVLVRPEQSDLSLRATVAHEIGHAVDLVTGSEEQRTRYRQLRGLPARTPWWPCDLCSDFRTGAGDWAEVFAYWLVGPGDFRSELAGPPDEGTLQELADLFRPPSARSTTSTADQPAPTSTRPTRPAPSPSSTTRPLLPGFPGR